MRTSMRTQPCFRQCREGEEYASTGQSPGNPAKFRAAGAKRRRALTLVELLVVLMILAILTVVAVQATESLLEQGRFDSTRRTLESVEEAIVGPAHQRQPDGTLMISGFVADMARLPDIDTSAPAAQQLHELWQQPAGVQLFGIKPAASDPEVLVPCGWRGPYLRLPYGTNGLRDGWGNPFLIAQGGGDLTIASEGADALPGGASFDMDTQIVIPATRLSAAISGQVVLVDPSGSPRTAGGPVSVTLFGPNPATGGPLETTVGPLTASMTNPNVYNFSFGPAVGLIGPRALRATEGATPVRKSRVAYLTVPSGGPPLVVLSILGPADAPPPMGMGSP